MSSNDQIKPGINSFDFDGVVSIGICPGPNDIIVTGRPLDEMDYVKEHLAARGIKCAVFFQNCLKKDQTRESSGAHKAATLKRLIEENNVQISKHFEDDPVQIAIIKGELPDLDVVSIQHSLTEK